MSTPETIERIKKVLRKSLKLDTQTPMEDTMALVGGEYDLDSLDILLIVTELEKEFGIRIREGTMNKTAFTSIETLASFVEQMKQPV
jgi:acyl carrier protein